MVQVNLDMKCLDLDIILPFECQILSLRMTILSEPLLSYTFHVSRTWPDPSRYLRT